MADNQNQSVELENSKSVSPLFVTVLDASKMLAVSPQTVRRLVARRKLPHCAALKGKLLIPRVAIEKLAEV